MKIKLLAVAVAATFAFNANAAQDGTLSLGVAGGVSLFKGSHLQSNESVDDKNGHGIKAFAEYNFANWFGLGLGYNYLADGKVAYKNADGFFYDRDKIEDHIGELYARFAIPLDAKGSDIFFKAGPSYGKYESGMWGAVAGLGAQYAFNDVFALRAGYDYFWRSGKTASHDGRLNSGLAYLGFVFTIGGKAPAPAPVAAAPAQKKVHVSEKHTLDADILFPFDSAVLSQKGKDAVNTIVANSAEFENADYAVYGYTDFLGSDAYNSKLSQKRADAVSNELKTAGVNATISLGKGEADPVTGDKCKSIKSRKEQIVCLQPDRRVEVVVTGDKVTVQ